MSVHEPERQLELTGSTVEVLQAMIRNACVNDGDPMSGQEVRNAELIDDLLGDLDREHYEPLPGRRSVLTTVEGSDPDAPTVLLLGHLDVVPVSADEWREDPFGGELIDGEIWGRGAVDMLNLTSSMAVAMRQLATRGHPPRSTMKFLGVADEEAGGTWGARWITDHAWDDVKADFVLTESGGIPSPGPAGPRIVMATAEKGIAWRRLTIRGTPSHGSMPWGSDNAVVTAAEIVRRLTDYEPTAQIHDHWRAWVEGLPVATDLHSVLLDAGRLREVFDTMDPTISRYCHAVTHTTFSPNVIHGGTKANTVPDKVELDVDIRTLPGITDDDVDAMLAEALGELADRVELSLIIEGRPATSSPLETPMFDLLKRRAAAVHPGTEVVPWMTVGGTDAAFFRQRGVPAYGAGMFSSAMTLPMFASRFHGHDERIDPASLGLSAQLWIDVADGLAGR